MSDAVVSMICLHKLTQDFHAQSHANGIKEVKTSCDCSVQRLSLWTVIVFRQGHSGGAPMIETLYALKKKDRDQAQI